jgi:hypothetical protein
MSLGAAQDIAASLCEQCTLRNLVEPIQSWVKRNYSWLITTDGVMGCGMGSMAPGDRLAHCGRRYCTLGIAGARPGPPRLG